MFFDSASPGFRQLGICRHNMRALLLLPIACVAWASRRRDPAALDLLIDAAAARAGLDGEALALARGWLSVEPRAEAVESGLRLLSRLARAPDEPLISHSDVLRAVVWACSAAQLDREPSAPPHRPVSIAARKAVRRLEQHLGVHVGDLWADVLADLGEELPRSTNTIPPRLCLTPDSSRDGGAGEHALAEMTPCIDSIEFDYAAPASVPIPLVRRSGAGG